MNPPISDRQPIAARDLEQLSAYLDGALSLRAHAQLDQRLKAEPQLAAALKHLQQTRALLRRAPERRVPRSFTLTSEMLGKAVPAARWNRFSLVSAVASLLLVFVLIGDFSVNGAPQLSLGASAGADAAEAPQTLMAESPEETTDQAFEQDTAEERQGIKSDDGFDLRIFFWQNVRSVELALILIILIALRLAKQRKRSP